MSGVPLPVRPAVDVGVRHTVAAYSHAVDDGRIADAAACFTADAVLKVGDDVLRGRHAIAGWLEQVRSPAASRTHLVTNVLVAAEGEGDERATATSDFAFVGTGDDGAWRVLVVGRYRDRFTPSGGRWLLAEREIVFSTGAGR